MVMAGWNVVFANYLNHHYIVDLLWGFSYFLISYSFAVKIFKEKSEKPSSSASVLIKQEQELVGKRGKSDHDGNEEQTKESFREDSTQSSVEHVTYEQTRYDRDQRDQGKERDNGHEE